jgi:hypothetical protein
MKRELTSHKVNGLNEALKILVVDEPGSGGANHHYQITLPAEMTNGKKYLSAMEPCDIQFQNGPIGEVGPNGISNESLLAIVEDRLKGFQSGPFANSYNQAALDHVSAAMSWLRERTAERVARGVEGTLQK